ncbi:MAG: aminoglycoside phosphotransferase family protein [bacterium]|nr:aminoglycoside phosphotransferase family protein [bacterium]
MDAPSRVTEADAHAFLEKHYGRPVEGVEFIGEGAWSRCFGYCDHGRELVIRFGRFVDDFEKDRRASSFDAPALPVPALSEIGQAYGAWFAVSARIRGEPLESCSESEWNAVLPSLFAALDAMREIDLFETTGYGGWDVCGDAPHASWRDFLLAVDRDTPELRTHGWRQRLIDSPGGDQLFSRGYETLAQLIDAVPSGRYVVHGDLINRNVFVAEGCITGIFDWGCSFYGDFLYEIAWLEFWAPWSEAMASLGIPARAREHFTIIGLDVPDFDLRLRACMIHIALDHLAYNAWAGRADSLASVSERMLPLLYGE